MITVRWYSAIERTPKPSINVYEIPVSFQVAGSLKSRLKRFNILIHRTKTIPRAITEGFPEGYYNYIGAVTVDNARAVPMTRVIDSGVDLTQFESDYFYSANFDMLFVERGSRLDTWLYLAL